MLATLFMSGTRSAIFVTPLVVAILFVWSASWGKTIAVTAFLVPVVCMIALVMSLGMLSRTAGWVESLLSFSEGSASAHTGALTDSIDIIVAEPLGRGLGTTHTVGFQRGIESSFANESWYLQLGTESGIIGMALYSLAILAATIMPFLAYRKLKDPWLRALTLGTAGAGLGVLLVGIVLHVWQAPVLAGFYWLLVGIAVRSPELEKQWEREEVEAETA